MKGRIIANFIKYVIPQYNFGHYQIQPLVKNQDIEKWQLIYTDDIGIKSKHLMHIQWYINNSGALRINKLIWHPGDTEYEKEFHGWNYRSARHRHRSLRKNSDARLLAEAFRLLQSLK